MDRRPFADGTRMNANQQPERTTKAIDLAEEPDFSLGSLGVQPSLRSVVLNEETEVLEPRVMQVLVALARRRGEVVSRDHLVELCWDGRVVGEDALNRSVAKVRRFASLTTFSIETIPRVGYKLTVALLGNQPEYRDGQEQPAPSGDAQEATPSTASDGVIPDQVTIAPIKRPKRHRWLLAGLVAFAIVTFAGIGYGYWYREELLLSASGPVFAVLRFDAIGEDPRTTRFVETIPTAIGSTLTSQTFNVVPASVSFQYRGDRKAAAATDLDPRYIIDGTVRLDADRVYVTTRIDAVSRPMTVWSQEFSAPIDAADALPQRIAVAVAELFNPGVRGLFEDPPEITAAVLQMSSRWRVGDDMGAYVKSREILRKASTNLTARIYFAIATGMAFDVLTDGERASAGKEARLIAEAAAKQAWWNGAPMAMVYVTPMVEWSRRETLLRKGLEGEYGDSSGLRRALATQLMNSGFLNDAAVMSQQALSVNRLAWGNVSAHGSILEAQGRVDELDALLAADVDSWSGVLYFERLRFSAALSRGNMAAATAMLDDPINGPLIDPPAERRPYRPIVRALQTRAADDIAAVEQACSDPSKLARFANRSCLQGLVLLDRRDTFFELAPLYFPELRGATQAEREALAVAHPRTSQNVRILFYKEAQGIRADERFISIAERMGLVDYWRASGEWPDFCKSEPTSVCAKMQAM